MRTAASGSGVPAVDDRLLRQIDQEIIRCVEAGNIPGAVLLLGRNGQVVYEKAYGHRQLVPATQPMTVDTVFDLASLTKPLATATSVMILVERGRLKLSDPVARHIPAFGVSGKSSITVEQLLLHYGGLIADNPLSDYEDGIQRAIERIMSLAPQHEPGSRFIYSDVGYIVLGRLVEAVDGRPLDRFAAEEIFRPLDMKDTCFLPPPELRQRCAPTEKHREEWLLGQVHDPRAGALGGVAGHAGLFGTARDLARYCQMILNGGQLQGRRVLRAETVREMIRPRSLPDGTNWRCCGFDVDSGYSSARGDRFEPRTTFGHTGFTGTSFWLDAKNNCYVILLTSRLHPDGKGDVGELRRRVATLAAEALLGPRPVLAGASVRAALGTGGKVEAAEGPVLCGIDVLQQEGFRVLRGRRLGIIANHTACDRQGRHLVDILLSQQGLRVVKLFSPEHGLYGNADQQVSDSVDSRSGLPIFSLYGQRRRPTADMLRDIDTLVFDIQDIGARFYTYISTLGICMEEAARHGIRMVVLDRPNPITGLIVDGPLADEQSLSFTAFRPIPVAHGMTAGELARLYNGHFNIGCDLTVVPMRGWKRQMWFDQTGLMWINPSPNMRNLTQAALYPGICLLEACNVSVGRGTDQPFEMIGAPWIDSRRLAAALNRAALPGLRFVPIEFTPTASRFAGQRCQGLYILVTDRNALEPVRAGLSIAWYLRELFGESFQVDRVGHLLANRQALESLKAARDPAAIPHVWDEPLRQFLAIRQRYLLYD